MADSDNTPQGAPSDEPLSRRRLVIGGIAAVGTAAVAATAFSRAANAVSAQEISDRVVSADPSLCVGCLACEVNCSTWHASVGRSAVARIRILTDSTIKLNTQLAASLPKRA